MFVCVCLLAAQTPIPLSQSQAGIDSLHTQHASPLESGHILPPAVRLRRPTSAPLSFSSSSLSSFQLLLLLLQSLLLPITLSFPWPYTEDLWWQRCQHRSRWSSPAVLFPLARESIHSSLFSVPINLLSVFSGPHSCPSRASTVQPYRGLVTLDYSRREACVNVSLSNPSSLLPVIQISHWVCICLSFSFTLPAYLLSFSGQCMCLTVSVSCPLLSLYTVQVRLSPPHLYSIGVV